MKKTFIYRCCITMLVCLCWLTTNAQQTVSVNLRKATLTQLFKTIEQQTTYVFSYQSGIVSNSPTITINRRKATVQSVLDEALRGSGLTYDIVSSHSIVVTRSEAKTSKSSSATRQSVSQQYKVNGTVTDSKGDPVIGAAVRCPGSNNGTVTDVDGHFELIVAEGSAIEVSYIGYTPKTVKATAHHLNITLSEDTKVMDEVVVVGYGTQKKVNLTGAVQSVGEEVFDNRSLSNVSQALQGAVPNLNLSFEDGKPSRSSDFNIRGATSIGQGGSALVLVDGVESDPSLLNPNDIESVSVLKDASSAAIYGARGAFGVVLITTKDAKKGKVTVNYTGNFNFESPTKKGPRGIVRGGQMPLPNQRQ